MHVFECLAEWRWHLLIQVLVVSLVLPNAIRYELIRAGLLNVIIEPRQVEFVHAEADQVQERFYVIDRHRIRVQLVLSQRRKHRIALKVANLAIDACLGGIVDALRQQ